MRNMAMMTMMTMLMNILKVMIFYQLLAGRRLQAHQTKQFSGQLSKAWDYGDNDDDDDDDDDENDDECDNIIPTARQV